jgi:flavodoxin
MSIEVRYFSRSGHTKKVAEAIAQAAGVVAKDCSVPLRGQVDLLFLGGAVYWGGADKQLKAYVEQLDPKAVKRVVVFGTSSIVEESTRELERMVLAKGIPVSEQHFHCWGAFAALHRGHPDSADLREAATFAKAVMREAEAT